MSDVPLEPLQTQFTIIVDAREKNPFRFIGLRADAKDKKRPLAVRTKTAMLPTGDYSILGYEDRVCIERKSLADLYNTLGQNRDRFEREVVRMTSMEFAAIVVEADYNGMSEQPSYSRLTPKHVFRTMWAWMVRYPRIHWVPASNRFFAESATFRLLEFFWRGKCRLAED